LVSNKLLIIGAGLAGCEAAWQAARRGIDLELWEMKPRRFTPAHHSPDLAELVCSNSLRADDLHHAAGLLKEEMRRLGSLVMESARATRVPAGKALAVDREGFARFITRKITENSRVQLVSREAGELPPIRPLILATGPLTTDELASALASFLGREHLHFYDAIAPIVYAETIDGSKAYRASRYDQGGDDYLNCPLTENEYRHFVRQLVQAEPIPLHSFESINYFEGCLPIEVMAQRGEETLRFGPMKPVGLPDPRTGKIPQAVVQLRQDNADGSLYNMVGFQTKLKWKDQERVFRLIPGLEQAEFARLGSVHRNTFVDGPRVLLPTLQLKTDLEIFLAGQITGVEGYVESAAMGILAGINAARLMKGRPLVVPPPTTALGVLVGHISREGPSDFQPRNINFGLFPILPGRVHRRERSAQYARRALEDFETWMAAEGLDRGCQL
jgi:methylenetetrahydrofolate--tRNA-(uracil-5-)-methyltransferase